MCIRDRSTTGERPDHRIGHRTPGCPCHLTRSIPMTSTPIRRALVSVYDKTGLEALARGLHAAGVTIVSTGSTAATIAAAGVPVTEVATLTGFPECLDGRDRGGGGPG